jgi:hypothetical protein
MFIIVLCIAHCENLVNNPGFSKQRRVTRACRTTSWSVALAPLAQAHYTIFYASISKGQTIQCAIGEKITRKTIDKPMLIIQTGFMANDIRDQGCSPQIIFRAEFLAHKMKKNM